MWWQVSVPATYAVKYGDLTAQEYENQNIKIAGSRAPTTGRGLLAMTRYFYFFGIRWPRLTPIDSIVKTVGPGEPTAQANFLLFLFFAFFKLERTAVT